MGNVVCIDVILVESEFDDDVRSAVRWFEYPSSCPLPVLAIRIAEATQRLRAAKDLHGVSDEDIAVAGGQAFERYAKLKRRVSQG